VEAEFSEIYFFGRGATPSMVEGPVQVNLFGGFVSGQQELFALCCRMQREPKAVRDKTAVPLGQDDDYNRMKVGNYLPCEVMR